MAHPCHHAESSARRFGGTPDCYIGLHEWFDSTKAHHGLFTHRALRHHTLGIFEAEERFGRVLTVEGGREVPTRFVAEQHVKEDCGGRIPSVSDWLRGLRPEPWMGRGNLLDDEPAAADDPARLWREEVAAGRTVLGLKDWLDRREVAETA